MCALLLLSYGNRPETRSHCYRCQQRRSPLMSPKRIDLSVCIDTFDIRQNLPSIRKNEMSVKYFHKTIESWVLAKEKEVVYDGTQSLIKTDERPNGSLSLSCVSTCMMFLSSLATTSLHRLHGQWRGGWGKVETKTKT